MIFAIAAAAPMIFSAPCDSMRSASEVGREIRQTLSGVSDHLRSSVTFGEPWRRTVSSLTDLMRECSQPGWDGYASPAISNEAASNAIQFIRTIPLSIPLPEISATPAGDITFEWSQTAHRIVTVAVGDTGEVHYASLNGSKRTFGSYPLDGNFEPELLNSIESMLG